MYLQRSFYKLQKYARMHAFYWSRIHINILFLCRGANKSFIFPKICLQRYTYVNLLCTMYIHRFNLQVLVNKNQRNRWKCIVRIRLYIVRKRLYNYFCN